MDTCKYVHYTIDYPESVQRPKLDVKAAGKHDDGSTTLFPPQVYISLCHECGYVPNLGSFVDI